MNKKYIIATCKAEYLQEDSEGMEDIQEYDEALVARADIKCMIRKSSGHDMEHYSGFGGFTVTPSGQVIGRCKAEK